MTNTVVKEFKLSTKKLVTCNLLQNLLNQMQTLQNFNQCQKFYALKIPGGLSVLLDKI